MSSTVDIAVVPVEADRDAELIHSWTSQERAVFWGMLDKPVKEVRDIYAWIQEQPHLAAYLVHADGAPVALFQTYDPFVDEIGEFYDRKAGDVGIHLLIGPGKRGPGVSAALLQGLADWVWSDPAHARIVFEPDARNDKSVAVLHRLGAEIGPQVDLPHKRAQFGFLTREAWFSGRR
ncbi:GNAT family N-acetyltransferase [Luteipulveratus halotolerans]|uniref:Lysine N-acyltransferase MbtK n=1 Tax=Luteipulveratus halotolerans TaxID=1631356 RepID=A0A0L6CL98_9MICO|nr:GNAT family N-acetyltransferase [Luteipulveratus halotolerans]KNX38420.1 hypothetical protein VV01_16740 [Luteipulveratus halotolerans]